MRIKLNSPQTRIPAVVTLALATALPRPAAAAPLKELSPPETAAPRGDTMPINERFPNLDAYLAYLERRSRMDGPWYRQVRPGVYELQTGNLRLADGESRKRVFTREELEKKFGFSR